LVLIPEGFFFVWWCLTSLSTIHVYNLYRGIIFKHFGLLAPKDINIIQFSAILLRRFGLTTPILLLNYLAFQSFDSQFWSKNIDVMSIIVTSYYVLQKLKNGTSNQVKMIAMRRDIFSLMSVFSISMICQPCNKAPSFMGYRRLSTIQVSNTCASFIPTLNCTFELSCVYFWP
jgi:hypothetical protein